MAYELEHFWSVCYEHFGVVQVSTVDLDFFFWKGPRLGPLGPDPLAQGPQVIKEKCTVFSRTSYLKRADSYIVDSEVRAYDATKVSKARYECKELLYYLGFQLPRAPETLRVSEALRASGALPLCRIPEKKSRG